ncbi:ornithine carbamoyltransferase [Syntrophorhabdus aromaticivorans]|uniref:Ornithine carbamoyltransferase n=1 Tax=Syntrophorhabdus aromaticivorans TaxID=328301 RepID=A0A351U569_9BACT|nr:ornithine carbamoyltransferase [Syntrophorhabdus aromaticivorans]NLW35185.1 ornithine carbamoyltransferase [Syntrophorhabdus aromaticivorans]HBA55100.1 ornithine carbamoyltransferase [Syntrophorhabdus aromaticivorans]
MKRDFTKLLDITLEEGAYLLERTAFLKEARRNRREYKPLKDRNLAMIFEKASTRTRVSFEVGMSELGGNTMFLSPGETQIGRGEPIKDTARVLSRYTDAIMIRTYSQENVEEFSRWASIPVINGLSDLYHPCQILADLFTVQEHKGSLRDVKIAYVGDGNNVANSWIEASILFGLNLSVASPGGYEPDKTLLGRAKKNEKFVFTNDPREAVKDADVVNTDVWASMGQEGEKEKRKKAFVGYRVDDVLLVHSKKDVIVMHCLPAYRNEEISEDVFERHQEVIFTQAENRLHAQKALLEWLIKDSL